MLLWQAACVQGQALAVLATPPDHGWLPSMHSLQTPWQNQPGLSVSCVAFFPQPRPNPLQSAVRFPCVRERLRCDRQPLSLLQSRHFEVARTKQDQSTRTSSVCPESGHEYRRAVKLTKKSCTHSEGHSASHVGAAHGMT